MTSPPNDYEKAPKSDNEQDMDKTIDTTMTPVTSQNPLLSSDQHRATPRHPQNGSQGTSFKPQPEPSSTLPTLRLALPLLFYRNLSKLLQNPFFALMACNSQKSTVRDSFVNDSRIQKSLVSKSMVSKSSPKQTSPKTLPSVSRSTSSDEETKVMEDTDVEMSSSPILSPVQQLDTESSTLDIPGTEIGTDPSVDTSDVNSPSEEEFFDAICVDKQTSDTDMQITGDRKTNPEPLFRLREHIHSPYSSPEGKEESNGKPNQSGDEREKLTNQIGSFTFSETDNDVKMTEPYTYQMRGLKNSGNTCFINAILQSLMACDPFRNLALSGKGEDGTLLEKFGHLAWEMTEQASSKSTSNDFSSEITLLPKWFLGVFKPSEADSCNHSGTQEDAEEFLSFLLNKLQDEEVAHRDGSASCAKSDTCSGWQKGIQGQRFVETDISRIFGGSSVSEVRRTSQDPSLTEASFFSVSLDVDLHSVNSISEALNNYHATEIISDGGGKYGEEMRIEKQLFMTTTPQILILHLKRFAYNAITFAPQKVMKKIQFPEVLEIPDSIMRTTGSSDEVKRKYELKAVVTHLGSRLAGGHYFCDVRFRKTDGSSIWVKCDDETLKEVTADEVLRRDAYVLFYSAI